MVQVTKELSSKIANMSFICAVLVVSVHVQRPFDSPFISHWIADGISDIAVPFFFIASGFFLVGHVNQSGWWKRAVCSRFWTLMVPFLLLNVLWLPVFYGCHYIGVWFSHADHSNPLMSLSLRNVLIFLSPIPLLQSPAIGPTWYIRVLFWLVVLSPMFVWGVRKSKLCAYSFVAFIWCVWLLIGRIGLTLGNSYDLRCIFYLVLGMSLRIWGLPFRHDVIIGRKIGAFLLVIGFSFFVINRLQLVSGLPLAAAHKFGVLLMIGGVWSLVPKSRWPDLFAKNTFPLYVLHGALIVVIGYVYKVFHLTEIFRSSAMFVVCVIAYTVASCLIATYIKEHFPRVAKLVFGGR